MSYFVLEQTKTKRTCGPVLQHVWKLPPQQRTSTKRSCDPNLRCIKDISDH